MINRRYENAVIAALAIDFATATPADLEIVDLAGECDRMVTDISSNVRDLAERFATFAQKSARGDMSWEPFSYSHLSSTPRDIAKLEGKRDELARLIRALRGSDAVGKFRSAYTAALAAEVKS